MVENQSRSINVAVENASGFKVAVLVRGPVLLHQATEYNPQGSKNAKKSFLGGRSICGPTLGCSEPQ